MITCVWGEEMMIWLFLSFLGGVWRISCHVVWLSIFMYFFGFPRLVPNNNCCLAICLAHDNLAYACHFVLILHKLPSPCPCHLLASLVQKAYKVDDLICNASNNNELWYKITITRFYFFCLKKLSQITCSIWILRQFFRIPN